MTALRILPGFPRSPAGLERAVLLRLPLIALAGTVLPIVGALVAPLLLGADPAGAKLATTIHIFLSSVLMLHWTVVFTVALFCVIVMIAKGPAYVADAYPLSDSDQPAR